MKPHPYVVSELDANQVDPSCATCGGKCRDAVHTNRAAIYWNELGEAGKDRFLAAKGFKCGWSAHTWKTLDAPIQLAFARFHGILS